MSDQQVSRSVLVAAPPQQVFDLLADFRRHPEFDGSGSVKKAMGGPARLSLGAKFGMRMRIGVPYPIRNEVVEFEDGRRIAWRHFGHHVWRYTLEPAGAGTKITETFDYAPSRSPAFIERMGYPAKNAQGIEATLARLQERFGTPAG